MAGGPVLLYDGVCGFCNASVRFVLARDRDGAMRFSPLQSDFGEAVLARHPEFVGIDSVVYLEPSDDPAAERVWVRSAAALRVARYLGGIWSLALVAYAVPGPVRDWLYDLFARHRYRFFGRSEQCAIPSPADRTRFLGEFGESP